MATYDDIYPDAHPDFASNSHDKLPPVVKFNYEEAADREEEPKCSCGSRTSWVNPTAMEYVCSTECNKEVWNDLITLFVAELILGSI